MTPDQLAYEFGTIIFLVIITQPVHWIVRKIRRKPMKLFSRMDYKVGALGLKYFSSAPCA
jgi:hypothetical protein